MQPTQQMSFPVPGRVLKSVLVSLFAVWLVFALAINWGGASNDAFLRWTGNSEAIAQGQVWRLVTAPFMHLPSESIGHILGSMIGLYFLGAPLESGWGAKRFAWFLFWTGFLSYAVQFAASLVLSKSTMAQLCFDHYFGAAPVVYAVAIAWASSFRRQKILLMFVLPVSSRALIWITVGVGLMLLIAGGMSPSGHIATFAGMGFGYLLGGGSPSPLRRVLLHYKLSHLERQVENERQGRRKKASRSSLKVIPGGRSDDDARKKGILH